MRWGRIRIVVDDEDERCSVDVDGMVDDVVVDVGLVDDDDVEVELVDDIEY